MRDKHWHILEEDGALTTARRVPVRFDLAVQTCLPAGSFPKIARQVRQDLWRALRDLRGFAPAVRVERCADGLKVTAGGQVEGALPKAQAEARIAQVLENAENRRRWTGWAT